MKPSIKKLIPYKNKKMKQTVFSRNIQTAKVLQFEKTDKFLTEQDMMNLFMGFIRLIKKSIAAEIESEYKKKLVYYQTKIKSILSKLN